MARTILLVDDDPDILFLLKLALEKHNFVVITAMDGEEGIRLFLSAKPDMVITDVNMPKKNGYEVIAAVRASSPNVKVFLFTASPPVKKIDGVDILQKPLRFDELLRRVCRDDN
jgi:DNA-binding response OmpR family regulator